MQKNDENKVKQLKEIRATLKSQRITTIELAKFLNMDSANLSDYLFFRKAPDDTLILSIQEAVSQIKEEAKVIKVKPITVVELPKALPSESDENESLDSEEMTEAEILDTEKNFEYSIPPLKLGTKIQSIRNRMALSEAEFAQIMQPAVSTETVMYWENNFGTPLLDYCIQISDMGVVTLDWLLKD